LRPNLTHPSPLGPSKKARNGKILAADGPPGGPLAASLGRRQPSSSRPPRRRRTPSRPRASCGPGRVARPCTLHATRRCLAGLLPSAGSPGRRFEIRKRDPSRRGKDRTGRVRTAALRCEQLAYPLPPSRPRLNPDPSPSSASSLHSLSGSDPHGRARRWPGSALLRRLRGWLVPAPRFPSPPRPLR
jgi:hypothetical protein